MAKPIVRTGQKRTLGQFIRMLMNKLMLFKRVLLEKIIAGEKTRHAGVVNASQKSESTK